MDSASHFNIDKLPKHKVELHVHLEGAIRISTIWDIAVQRGIDLSVKTAEELECRCRVKKPSTLSEFLKHMAFYLPALVGDPVVIERIAYEFCEDSAKHGVLYTELRYSPHLLSSTYGPQPSCDVKEVTPSYVVKLVNKGLERGMADFGIKVRTILCCITEHSEWTNDVLQLCHENREAGVVGIDIAGCDLAGLDNTDEFKAVFQRAVSMGIHRTVHAGEDGPASQVKTSVHDLRAERIGHGYHVVDDPEVYAECLEAGIHFETCPMSSLMTGAVSLLDGKHPIVRFAEDDANFSINRDDPTVIQNTLDDDYEMLRKLGLRNVHFTRANFNAARSAFLPADEKEELLKQLRIVYGAEPTS